MDFNNKEDVEKLIKACVSGNRQSQQTLYKSFYSKMLTVCFRYSSNSEEAKDILHDGFIKVFNKLSGFKNEGSLEGWIRRIMVNNAIDHVRKKKETFVSLDNDFVFESITSENESEKEAELFINIRAELLLKLVQKLSPAYKTVFNMYVFEDYSHKEIAEILGINIGTSKSNLAKAKLKLREFYKKYEYELEK